VEEVSAAELRQQINPNRPYIRKIRSVNLRVVALASGEHQTNTDCQEGAKLM
jgi:hypothetical protein